MCYSIPYYYFPISSRGDIIKSTYYSSPITRLASVFCVIKAFNRRLKRCGNHREGLVLLQNRLAQKRAAV